MAAVAFAREGLEPGFYCIGLTNLARAGRSPIRGSIRTAGCESRARPDFHRNGRI